MASSERDGPFRRWSRLKRQGRERDRARPKRGGAAPAEASGARAEATTAAPRQDTGDSAVAGGSDHGEAAKEVSSPEAAEGLPPIESLTQDSDFTQFLRAGVPDALKQAALRKLWRIDPMFLKQEELHDCFGDYANMPLITEKDTSYRVGKGFLDAIEEVAKETVAGEGTPSAASGDGEQLAADSPPDAKAAADAAPKETAAGSSMPGGGAKDSDTS